MQHREERVTQLLARHGLLNYRDIFAQEQYSKKTMPKLNDHLIRPFTLTAAEKDLPSGLVQIASSNAFCRITPIEDNVLSTLVLEPLKRKPIEEIKAPQSFASPIKKSSSALPSKGAEKKRRKSAPIGHEDAGAPKKRPRPAIKKSDDLVGRSSGVQKAGSKRMSPDELHRHLEKVFKYFWELELSPPSLATPFFGILTRANCDVLGLPRFFDKVTESCTLANISEKLKSGLYTDLESFEADFALMFNNIFLYFPESSQQYQKAKELQIIFRDHWTNLLLDLKRI